MADEVREIPFGQAIKISLDNYYDLLKTNVGSLQAEEFLQLKLVADPLDINQDQYEFFSYYTMLVRSDAAIEPQPVGGEIVTSAATLASVYGRFLQKLRGFIVQTELTADDQKTIASLDLNIEDIRKRQGEYFKLDVQEWKEICEVRGIPVGDSLAYFQWSSRYGHINEIEQLTAERQSLEFKRRTILNREYAKPEDKDVVTAEADFENPGMRLRYPMYPDYVYGRKFTLEDLARMDLGSTALFDDRRAVTWNQSLTTLKTAKQGSLNAVFDKNTGNSNSIATDWSASGSAGYWFLKVRANASEATKVSEEFSHATGITLSSEAAFRVNIIWPKWFQPVLFQHTRVRENARDFSEFFGANGSAVLPNGADPGPRIQDSLHVIPELDLRLRPQFQCVSGRGIQRFRYQLRREQHLWVARHGTQVRQEPNRPHRDGRSGYAAICGPRGERNQDPGRGFRSHFSSRSESSCI